MTDQHDRLQPDARSSGRGHGPRPIGLVILALSAFALFATSAPVPTLTGHAIGEVVLGGGESADRELRVQVDPSATNPNRGFVTVGLQAASGLQAGYASDVTVALVGASDAAGSFEPSTFPVDRCQEGCDLRYVIRITAGPSVLPGSVVRYEADVRVEYDYVSGAADPDLLRIELEGATTGPVAPTWSILAGLLALVAGLATGPAVDRRLGAARRRWPARALMLLPVAMLAWIVVTVATTYGDELGQVGIPWIFLAFLDPWSIVLLATLVWGVWRGLRAWPSDGGWLLGLAAVAATGLGGLWLAWWTTLDAVVQPIVLGIVFALLGALGGVVVGQGWRTDPIAQHDRWWAALAVLSHGIVIAGFGFLAEQSFYDPFGAAPSSLLALLPAALVIVGFRRWLSGRQAVLIVVDLLVAAAGVLGVLFWASLGAGFSTGPARLSTDDVGVAIAVLASIVALVTAFHAMPRRGPAAIEAVAPPPPAPPVVSPAAPSGDATPTT